MCSWNRLLLERRSCLIVLKWKFYQSPSDICFKDVCHHINLTACCVVLQCHGASRRRLNKGADFQPKEHRFKIVGE